MIKRGFDIIVVMLAMVPALPLMIIVALAIKLTASGSVIFRQSRVGQYGRMFEIYKFRSMVEDAASIGPFFTRDNDPRITAVGRFIRKTSLDELPQLFNVLRGEMSIVGPRPNVADQVSEYTNEQWEKRNSVRPGITGLAQAMLRSEATAEERTRLDLDYIDRMSLGLDLWVILLTVKQVLFGGGN